jgi:6-phosphogluconate dehydrogenase
MVRRFLKAGHHADVFDMSPKAVAELVAEKAIGSSSMEDFVKKLTTPRAVWLMVPAGVVDKTVAELAPLLEPGDILIDGGNSYYIDDIRRAKELRKKEIHYVDVGTSGGVWGLERGYCMMIGGEVTVVKHLDPIFAALAPGMGVHSTHSRARELRRLRRHTGVRLPALRSQWGRPLRQDGSQWNRIRNHGGLR